MVKWEIIRYVRLTFHNIHINDSPKGITNNIAPRYSLVPLTHHFSRYIKNPLGQPNFVKI